VGVPAAWFCAKEVATMKLYMSPGACSLSPHIVLREAGLPFEAIKVDLGKKQFAAGDDFLAINPKGYVPALGLDDGQVLTEGAAIVQYLGDLKPESHLVPANGTMARYRLQEWLTFISSELHKQYSPLFNPKSSDEVKAAQKERIHGRLLYVTKQLGDQPYLMGAQFTVADAYLYNILSWSGFVGVDLAALPVIAAYVERVKARPAVKAALEAEAALRKS
jgi:glutathione S-transferase